MVAIFLLSKAMASSIRSLAFESAPNFSCTGAAEAAR